MGVTPDFWLDRNVFLTGSTGFKGAWLALWLESLGARVTGYALDPPTQPSLYSLARVGDGCITRNADVRDADALAESMRAAKPEIVFHLAAQSLVRRSYVDPAETYSVNVVGTANVFETARRVETVRVVVNVTSDKCYANPSSGRRFVETDPKGGDDPYSSSKACSELVTDAYRTVLGDDGPVLVAVRAGNVIGGGDWAEDRLLPDAVRAALADQPLVVRRAESVRPWQHVLNPLLGYLAVAERAWSDRSYGTGWNFGPDESDELSVREVVRRFAAEWGSGFEWRTEPDDGPPEAAALRLDSTQARRRLGWAPIWNLDEGLKRTVTWYRAQASGHDIRAVTLTQLEDFSRAASGVWVAST